MKKTLLENGIPINLISKNAKIEKTGAGRPKINEMHYYWTRKSLLVSRAVVLASLLPNDFPLNKYLLLLGIEKKKPFLKNYTEHELEFIHEKTMQVI